MKQKNTFAGEELRAWLKRYKYYVAYCAELKVAENPDFREIDLVSKEILDCEEVLCNQFCMVERRKVK